MTRAFTPVPKPEPRRKPMADGQHRRKYIQHKRPRRLDTAQSQPDRLNWIHTQVCEVRRVQVEPGLYAIRWKSEAGCHGRIHACHEGERKPGLALKSSDSKSIALCREHDKDWTRHEGFFAGWTKEQRREWADERGAAAEALYLSSGSRRAA